MEIFLLKGAVPGFLLAFSRRVVILFNGEESQKKYWARSTLSGVRGGYCWSSLGQCSVLVYGISLEILKRSGFARSFSVLSSNNIIVPYWYDKFRCQFFCIFFCLGYEFIFMYCECYTTPIMKNKICLIYIFSFLPIVIFYANNLYSCYHA